LRINILPTRINFYSLMNGMRTVNALATRCDSGPTKPLSRLSSSGFRKKRFFLDEEFSA